MNYEGKFLAAHVPKRILDSVIDTVLLRSSKEGKFTSASQPIKNYEFDITSYLNHAQYNQAIVTFWHTLEDNFQHCDKSKFYNNIKTLRIFSLIKNKDSNSKGKYNGKDNYIAYYYNKGFYDEDEKAKDTREAVIFHELFHLASSDANSEIQSSGFKKHKRKNYIGVGINEGYTELLTVRYFKPKLKYKSYPDKVFFAEGIEKIVEQQEMEKAYFDNGLRKLVDLIAPYAERKDVYDLLREMDDIDQISEPKEYQKKYLHIATEIANIQIKKHQALFKYGVIDKEEYYDGIVESAFYSRGYSLTSANGKKILVNPLTKQKILLSDSEYRIVKNSYLSSNPEIPFNENKSDERLDIVEFSKSVPKIIESKPKKSAIMYLSIDKKSKQYRIHYKKEKSKELDKMLESDVKEDTVPVKMA